MSVPCTNCGAAVEARAGEAAICPHCGTLQHAPGEAPRETRGFGLRGDKPPLPLVWRLPLAFLALIAGLVLIYFRFRGLFHPEPETPVVPIESLRAAAQAPAPLSWDGKSPFRCDGSEQALLANLTVRLPERTALTVSGNCTVRLINVDIIAYEGIRADGNGTVTLENSRIHAEQVGVWADGNKRIEIIGSRIEAGGTAVRAATNVDVILTSGRIEGRLHALELSDNADAEVHGTEVVGDIQRSRNTSVTGLDTTKRASRRRGANVDHADNADSPSGK